MSINLSSSEKATGLHHFHGQGAAVMGLIRAFMSGAPAHATLITGPEGVGKRTLSSLLAQALHCEGGKERPCGACPRCVRFLSGNHPDAHVLERQKRIGIDQVRQLTEALASVAYEGGVKTVRIDGADAMTQQAQNALLKTLEEPPGNTVFLLTAVSLSKILPTIRSRCVVVRMPPLSEEAVRDILLERGVSEESARRAARLSGGSAGEAIRLSEDGALFMLRQRVEQALESVTSPADAWSAVNALKDDRAEAADICGLLESTIRGMLRIRVLGEGTPEGAFESRLCGLETRTLAGLLASVLKMRQMLASNVSWQAVLERFILEYVEGIWQS